MKNGSKCFFFLGSCSSSSKCPRHLSCSSFSFGAILILPLLWHLAERSHILSLHRQTCWTAGCPVYKLHSPTIHWCEAPVQESDLQCCPSVLSSSKETMDRLQYCPEHLLLLTSKPQKKKKKQFGVGMPPWILIIERFLGHTRFISGKQGPSSDVPHTVIQKRRSLQLCDFS